MKMLGVMIIMIYDGSLIIRVVCSTFDLLNCDIKNIVCFINFIMTSPSQLFSCVGSN